MTLREIATVVGLNHNRIAQICGYEPPLPPHVRKFLKLALAAGPEAFGVAEEDEEGVE
jgi:hypothetical protein